ncbi:MAG: 3-oxoacyl-[acyl-carrier-protein] reductase [Proteobacteria bacterium]|nr:3-oxoacyl-[acyl-carrier-protein] reductase [Pseudomonadota bacterium]
MQDSNNLTGQVALVTGSGRGIGRAIALKLARCGAKIAVNYSRSSEHADSLVKEIAGFGGVAQSFCFDVADDVAVEKAVEEIIKSYGSLDILVNNAGVAIDGLLMRTKKEDWQKTLDINLTGCFNTCKSVSRYMLKAKRGRIINISSVIGESGNAGQSAYAASKSAMFGFSKSLAKELGSRGITVNVVAPGFIKTDMTAAMNENQIAELLKQIPLGKLGEADDVAELVNFLASPAAAYITGEIIAVNGGMHM